MDAMSSQTKLGKAVKAAVEELEHLGNMVRRDDMDDDRAHTYRRFRAEGCDCVSAQPATARAE